MTDKNVNPEQNQADDNQAGENVDERFADIVDGVDIDAEASAEGAQAPEEQAPEELSREAQLEALLAERTEDLQRLQAEYVNYKRRVDRDRALSRQAGVDKVITDLMPVLDSIAMARQHGEVEGGFKLVVDDLEKVTNAHGLTSFGEVGDAFDPTLHEALMQLPMEGVTVTSVSQVMQPGYKLGDRVLRPARVAVSDPDPNAAPAEPGATEPGAPAESEAEEPKVEESQDQTPETDD
ncbi:nucleotide exchange factor GrpE [Cutibacterium sp.]|uniref:nucleotide exchange factor GrpE n=1 Tax=Cutibacterium sp. TaxID=1912221 RepID=UPI0026DC3C36|nr:nucleotide exchange factor GrpE [Cutibacterium sp.]MDO4412275.1 nucleotide exchange factor GrpE [Cutibacterium sp.]